MLGDTGCLGVVVKQVLVRGEQITKKEQDCMLGDGSIVNVPVGEIQIDTPYYVGKAETACMKRP